MEDTFDGRTRFYLQRAARAAEEWYDDSGKWMLDSVPPETRERLWICFALYESNAEQLADAVILSSNGHRSHMGWINETTFDIFHTNIACVLLILHRKRMSLAVQERLESWVRDGFDLKRGNRRPDYQFHGYNDNMPSKAAMGLILGGEMLGDRDAVDHGTWDLRQLGNMLARRGINSEWNSPTYSPATLCAIGKIAQYAQSEETRQLAAKIEERLWIDLAARFHAGTGVLAGPYSRAYTVDLIAHSSSVSALLWFVLGDLAKPSPMKLFEADSGLVLHHMGDAPFNIASNCWFAAGSYHLSPRIWKLFLGKQYPFSAVATAEMGDAEEEFPARAITISTYQEADFTVGTSCSQFLEGGQAAPYFVTYKRGPQVLSYREVGTIFHKWMINDENPGANKAPLKEDGSAYPNSGEQDNLNSRGNVLALQSGPSVLLLTHPHLALGGDGKSRDPVSLTRLSEALIFPCHFGRIDEIRVGETLLSTWAGEVPERCWIGVRSGRLLIAIRPLAYSRDAGRATTTLERINRYEVLRNTYYAGPSRLFSRSQLQDMCGGFMVEHASVNEHASLQDFLAELSSARFTDYVWTTRRTRYRRAAGKNRSALELETSWSPGAVSPRYALVDGRPLPQDRRVAIDGVDEDTLPLLSEPCLSAPSYFPWPALEANWGTGSLRGFVGDRE